ncbi:MAG: hypothetical protein ACM30E_03660 [Nitrososphaerales archaeon]
MKHLSHVVLVLVLLAVGVGAASAAFTGPYYDTYVILGSGGTNNPTAPQVVVADSTGTCNDTWIGYLQFDASGIGTVSSASLVLTHGGTLNGLATNPTLTLYGVPDFDLATVGPTNAPTTGAAEVIENKTIASGTTSGTKLTWGGSDPGLKNYIQSQADTDDVVTLAMSFSANCSTTSQVNFYSQEYSTAGSRPVLTVEGTKPNAVEVSTASAQRASSWPLYAGLSAVALFVVTGVVISRRRTA